MPRLIPLPPSLEKLFPDVTPMYQPNELQKENIENQMAYSHWVQQQRLIQNQLGQISATGQAMAQAKEAQAQHHRELADLRAYSNRAAQEVRPDLYMASSVTNTYSLVTGLESYIIKPDTFRLYHNKKEVERQQITKIPLDFRYLLARTTILYMVVQLIKELIW